jgi:hypothetical protein
MTISWIYTFKKWEVGKRNHFFYFKSINVAVLFDKKNRETSERITPPKSHGNYTTTMHL